MRRTWSHARRHGDMDVTMTPMIDVVFLLLIFFVWTASFQIVEYVLPSNLLTTGGSAAASEMDPQIDDFDQVVVRLLWRDGGPSWLINDAPVERLSDIRRTLSTVARIKNDVPVILDPEQDVPLGHVVDVYDISRQVGFKKIQFAVSEDI